MKITSRKASEKPKLDIEVFNGTKKNNGIWVFLLVEYSCLNGITSEVWNSGMMVEGKNGTME